MELQMHRAAVRPEWASVPVARRNVWQRLAAASRGVLTPGNICTFAGFALVVVGLVAVLREAYLWAFGLIFVGRMFDLLDGWLADITATKSPLGEKLDAGIDKLETVLAVPVLVYVTAIPGWLAIILILPHLAIAGVSAYGMLRHRQPQPSRYGKFSMAAVWACLGLMIVTSMEWSGTDAVRVVAYVIGGVSVIFGSIAAAGYFRSVQK